MKKRERTIISFIILLFLWGTILTGPFRYFAWMTRDAGSYAMGKLAAGGDFKVFAAYLISILCMVGLFILGRSKNRGLLCAVCAISSLCFYLVQSGGVIMTNQTVPLFIAIGLALALIASVIRTNAIEQWLSDLFVLSIPVMIVYDALLTPLFSFLKLGTDIFAPYIEISPSSIFMDVTFLHWPVLVWGLIITALAIIPTVYFTTSQKASSTTSSKSKGR